MRPLLAYARPHRGALALGVVLGLLGTAAALAQPLVAREVIETLGDERPAATAVLLLTALVLAAALVGAVNLWLLERTGERIVLRARLGLIGRVLRLRVGEHDRQASGDLLSRVASDTTLLRAVTTTGITETLNGVVALVGTVVLMAVLDLTLLGVTLGVLVVVALAVGFVLPRIGRAMKRSQEAVGAMGARLERALGAIRTVKASGAVEREAEAVGEAARAAYAEGVAVARYTAIAGVSTGVAVQFSFLAVLGVGGARVAAGSLDVGTLVAFLLYLFYLVEPIASLTMGATQLQEGLAAVARIREVEELPVEEDPPAAVAPSLPSTDAAAARARPPSDPDGAARARPPFDPGGASDTALVRFEDVRFGYRDDRPPVLRGVDLEVPARGQTAIVGPSGAGKTTIFALLERFYEPDAGRIVFADDDIATLPLDALRKQIGYVEQDAPVLAGTLRDNLLLATPGAGDDELRAVVAETRLDVLVGRLPQGLETEVGGRGTTLSGGERQRVAIARALLRRPRLLLLDEVTAQLDAVNERALQEAVARAGRRCAVLVIAHRLSTVVAAERIVVLDSGRVRAAGTHAELVREDELYRELAATQLVGP